MKKTLLIVMACLAISLVAEAQKQQGVVRTLEKAKRPSQGIEGVTIGILEYPNVLVTKKGGKFSFSIPGKKQGDSYKVSRVQKKGYTLVDKHLQGRQYSYSASVPLEIVMVSDKQLAGDKKLIEDKAFARAKKTYEARIADLERQLAEKAISDSIYHAERERLNDDYDKYIELIGEMAERYAMTDYKGLSEINRQILECIENAELERADSLINSKGDFDQRERELREQQELNQATAEFLAQSQRDAEFKLNDLAEDYYNKYTIYKEKYQYDSAAYYLMRRASLDTTNVKWLAETGDYIRDYLADYDLALNYFQNELMQAHIQFGEDSENAALSYNHIGSVYFSKGDYDKALEYYQKDLEISEHVLGTQHPHVATSYSNIGSVYFSKGDYDKALEFHQKALNISEHDLGTEHPFVATSYNHIGIIYYSKGDYDKALEFHQKALDIRERVLGSNHLNVAMSYNNIGIVYTRQRDYDKALEYYQKALDIYERVLGTQHPDVATSYSNIGLVYDSKGDYDKALEYHQKALDIYERVLGTEHPHVATSYSNIGSVYDSKGDYDKALEYYQKALDFYERVLGTEYPHVATSYSNIGSVYKNKGDYDKALEYLQKALDIRERVLGTEHPSTKKVKNEIDEVKKLVSQP